MYRPRSVTPRLARLFEAFPVVVVCGARQVGKTTLLRHVFPDLDYVVLDPALDIEGARAEPDLFLRNHPPPAIIDEIQYAPALVAAIKRRVDEAQAAPGLYLLSGSQQWQVMRSMAESLAGRAAFLDLTGFSIPELAGTTDRPAWLQRWIEDPAAVVTAPGHDMRRFETELLPWLWRGFLPGVYAVGADMVTDFWTGYHRTYVERDARLAGDISDWQQFGMFVRLIGTLTAQEVNYSQLGREIGMTPQTAQRWLRVLEGTFQWLAVPAFKGNVVKRVSSKPKGHMTDTGLVCHHALITTPSALAGHPLLGALFETAVACEIRKQAASLPGQTALHHWRSAGGAEVDLILERDGVLHPLEIKLTANPTRRDGRGLAAFRQAHSHLRVAPGALVCAVDRPRWLTEDTGVIPWNLL
ncbi:MAG: DUF4143 domain-containing protein [Thermoanaerobaculaceae bacterium]|jgi:hypothetical protein|nr:DUF4143 domain-containing protein [Thermoanaerobaculaceae bacterium]